MAEERRTRRSTKPQEAPDRVSRAAQQMQAAPGRNPQQVQAMPGDASFPFQNRPGPYGPEGQAPYPGSPEEYYYQQQEYARRQYAWQQEQQMQRRQQEERKRVTSQTFSYGAFRGYTGQVPVPAENGSRGAEQPPARKSRLGLILTLSLARHPLLLLAVTALVLGYACTLPARELLSVLRPAFGAAILTLLLLLPAMLIRPSGRWNNLLVAGKVFLSLVMVNLFNRRTQWNQITGALRKLHVPGVFVFVLDLTLKYIVLLGELLAELLTARSLRAVGRDRRKYRSVGGVLGVTFLRSAELSRETWEAMCCRCFTDDDKGL